MMSEQSVGGDDMQRRLRTERVFRTTKKSVISAPAWPPKPKPAVPMALGADHADKSQRIRKLR
jgi:hypothetical protein